MLPKKSELPKIWGGCSAPPPPPPARTPVVVSSKLTTESLKIPVGRDILHLVRHAGHGWIPALKSPEDHKVQVCCNGEILSGIKPVTAKQKNMSHFTQATSFEIGGEGKEKK